MTAYNYLELLRGIDSVTQEELKAFVPFIIDEIKVGLVEERVCQKVCEYSHVIDDKLRVISGEDQTYLTFSEAVNTCEERTQVLTVLTEAWRDASEFETLLGWRNELFSVYGNPKDHKRIFFKLERSASSLFGIGTYGSHLNGLVRTEGSFPRVWIGRRAESKQTWPSYLDNTVGGGIPAEYTPRETIVKESMEEAGIPSSLARNSVLTGTVSYIITALGIEQSTLFVYDLYLPEDFQPIPQDGEVSAYYLYTFEEIEQLLLNDRFMPDAAIVIIDLFIRFGYITPETNPHYQLLIYGIHRRLEVPPIYIPHSS
ncbi:hypothetical protein K7432_010175 [Basidiobolus ranarum]|uniref:Nudix hydrolase domain-containing protein n=1 Tax=Basidiobolus ranarum TaxID=34480 RepID=A0ABR2WP28_9FUNG